MKSHMDVELEREQEEEKEDKEEERGWSGAEAVTAFFLSLPPSFVKLRG